MATLSSAMPLRKPLLYCRSGLRWKMYLLVVSWLSFAQYDGYQRSDREAVCLSSSPPSSAESTHCWSLCPLKHLTTRLVAHRGEVYHSVSLHVDVEHHRSLLQEEVIHISPSRWVRGWHSDGSEYGSPLCAGAPLRRNAKNTSTTSTDPRRRSAVC